jgi:hypothetical protein
VLWTRHDSAANLRGHFDLGDFDLAYTFEPMPTRPHSLRPGALGLAIALALLSPRLARARAVPGAELSVSRSRAASSCPSETELASELEGRASARAESSEPLFLRVALDARGSAFEADVQVSGRKQGERALRAEGPTCEALHDVLLVSLLLLLDDDSDGAAPDSSPKPLLAAAPRSAYPSGWLTVGGAGTHGLPSAWSSAWHAELTLRSARWDVSLGGLWAPERQVDFAPGQITLQTVAARAQGCYALGGRELRLNGCAVGLLGSLRGQARDFSDDGSARRTWLLLGLGPELRWFPSGALNLGISGQLLASAGRQTFSVSGLQGPAYRTDELLGWLGADLSVRIW